MYFDKSCPEVYIIDEKGGVTIGVNFDFFDPRQKL